MALFPEQHNKILLQDVLGNNFCSVDSKDLSLELGWGTL